MNNIIQSKVYLVVLTALVSGFVGWGLGWFQVQLEISSVDSDPSSLPQTDTIDSPKVERVEKESPGAEPPPSPLPTPASVPSGGKEDAASPTPSPKPSSDASGQGGLRVSNQTDYPIRVALLARQPSTKSYAKPAHWDFAPGEGGSNGLSLSLPEGKLLLAKGDVLVAFAEDGSRRYWGPYVLGETPSPVWNSQLGEWQLVLHLRP